MSQVQIFVDCVHTWDDITEMVGITITVADGAIWRSFRLTNEKGVLGTIGQYEESIHLVPMSSVSRFLRGKAVDREKLVRFLGPGQVKPDLTKVYSSERPLSAGKCCVWPLPSGRRNWILKETSNENFSLTNQRGQYRK